MSTESRDKETMFFQKLKEAFAIAGLIYLDIPIDHEFKHITRAHQHGDPSSSITSKSKAMASFVLQMNRHIFRRSG